MTVGVGRLREHRQTIAADDVDRCSCDRRAVRDRLHEHILRSIDRTLHDQAQIGHDDQSRIVERAMKSIVPVLTGMIERRIGGGIPCLYSQQEDAALIRTVVVEIVAQIQRFVLRLSGCDLRERQDLHEALGDVRAVEGPAVELRRLEAAAGLGHQMLQLARQQAADFDAHGGHIAREQRDRLLAGER